MVEGSLFYVSLINTSELDDEGTYLSWDVIVGILREVPFFAHSML